MSRTLKTKAAIFACFIFSTTAFSQASKPSPQPSPAPKGFELFKVDPKVEAALKELMAADDKRNAEEFFKRGEAAWKQFEITETLDLYTKALELVPNYADALRERGVVSYMIGKHENAIRDLSAFLKSQPASAKVLFYRGMAYSAVAKDLLDSGYRRKEAGDTAQKSLADFNDAIAMESSNVLYYNGRGRLLLDFEFYKEGITDFEKAISLDAKSAVAYSNLGLAKFLSAGQGLAEINRAIELNPKFGEAYFNRANYYRVDGKPEAAIVDYTRAIAEKSTKAEYYNARGMVYFVEGDGTAAAKDFSAAVAQKQDFALAYFNRALTYKRFPGTAAESSNSGVVGAISSQRRKMSADLDAAIKYNPNLADAYVERGFMNSTALPSKLDEKAMVQANAALADFDQAIKLDGSAARALDGRGSIYEKLGKKDAALADYNKAIEIDPMLATAYMGRMGIYCEMGKTELSIADEKKVKELGFAALNVCSLRK